MASKKSRTRNHRRDRRKAKESNWKREGKKSWGKVAHGAGTASVGCDVRGSSPKRLARPKNQCLQLLSMNTMKCAWPEILVDQSELDQ